MKETLEKFSYTPKGGGEYDDSGDIHIEGSTMNWMETLCGTVDSMQEREYTDKMPTCKGCLDVYNMVKNGKLRK